MLLIATRTTQLKAGKELAQIHSPLLICRSLSKMSPASMKRPSPANRDISPPPAKRKAIGTVTNRAVANFFKPPSQKEPEKVAFSVLHDTLLVARYENAHTAPRSNPVKLAAFDFDSTLIATKSGLKFARSEDDWKWWHASVPSKLKQLNAEGYTVVIISNQAGVSLRSDGKLPSVGMKSLKNLKGKIVAVLQALDLPISVYAATGHDIYRKPRAGMWEQLLQDYGLSDGCDVDHEKCVFVGDAAGRAEDKASKTKKDHSCSDRDLAANIHIPFKTPEEFFLGEEPKPCIRAFDPAEYLETGLSSQTESSPILFAKKNDVDIVLFCGSPGAGKSTFYWRHLQPLGYERVNQDNLKTRDKCMKVTTQFIEDGTAVVVDNTNADIETRAAWIALARKLKITIRIVHFTASAKLCEHNDTVRALSGDLMNPEKRTMLPKMAFTGFAARYREPTVDEGFHDITKVVFKFEGNEEQKAAWRKYWIS